MTTRGPEDTLAFAFAFGRAARGGEAIGLSGPLGAGKTTFTKGLAEGLGIAARDVTSPTFLLLHELSGRLPLRHLDAFRVTGSEELLELGVGEMLGGDAVVVLEWPERVPDLLPADRLEITIAVGDDELERSFTLLATGPRHEEYLAGVLREVGK